MFPMCNHVDFTWELIQELQVSGVFAHVDFMLRNAHLKCNN